MGIRDLSARCLIMLALAAAALPAAAANKTWLSAAGGNATNWSRANNWSPAGAPAAADDIIIPTIPANGVGFPVLNATSTVATLTIQSGASLTGAATFNLTVSGNASITSTGVLNVNASTITVGGTLSGTGTVNGNTGTLNVAGGMTVTTFTASTSTVVFNGTAAQSVGAYTFNNFTISNTSAAVSAAANFTVNGTLTMNGAATVLSPAAAVVVGGTGTLTGTGTVQVTRTAATADFSSQYTISGKTLTNLTVEYNGAAPQTLSALTYGNLKINNANGVTLVAANATASGTLTLTSGVVTTGANTLITTASCPGSLVRTSGWVNGNLREAIPAGASTCTFEIGDANNYTPVVLVFVAGTGAGNLTGSTTGGDHPQLGSSGINATNSVNRFWTFTNAGVTLPAAGYSATFNFINGSPVDVDNLGLVGSYIVEEWNGSLWFPATLSGSCTATPGTNLCKQITGEMVFGDFAIGGAFSGFNANPGAFNTFEATASTTQILGRIFTKLAGTSFTLSIVAVSNNARNAAPSTNQLTVEIINSSGTPGAFSAATNCWSGWTSVQSQTVGAPVGWTSGRVDVTINAPTQAVRDARIRVTQAGTGLIGCSADRFTVRPAAFTISSSANNNGSGAGTTVKTGANFSITAQPVRSDLVTSVTVGYDGTPSIDSTKVVGSPNAGAIGGSFSAAAGGAATGSSFFYSEVGNFGLNANAIFDSSFSVDSPNDCTADFSNALVGGQYGCSIGHSAIAQTTGSSGFGRFIPDNFAVSLNTATAQFSSSCGTFSYVGQSFSYATAPVITVTARNGTTNGLTNATTTNYAGAYLKITNASLTPATQPGRYSRFDALGGGTTPALDTSALNQVNGPITFDPTIGSFTNGVGALTFNSGGGLAFAHSTTTPAAPYSADIALALNVIDSDGVAYAGNPASFGAASAGSGIAFSGGNNAIRYGRVRILNGSGPTTVDVPMTLQAEYYVSAASGFTTNTTDTCTSFVPKNFVLFGHQGSITPANMISPTAGSNGNVSISGGLTLGVANLKLLKPTGSVTTPGSVKICLDLDSAAGVGDTSCQAATPANRSYLQGPWSGSSNYDKDPSAQMNLGLFGAQPKNFIFFRENY